jgi:hypothetical protein
MLEKLLKILKDPKYLKCWYPSGGTNFIAIEHWNQQIGNKIHPKNFIFTDGQYLKEHFNTYLYTISKLFNVDIENIATDKTDTSLKLYPNTEDPDFKNWIEDRTKVWMKEGSEDDIELKGLGILDIDQELNEEFTTQYFKSKNASVFYFYFNDISIFLINCSNEVFYNYCIKESISLDTIMLYRHQDYEFVSTKEELIIRNLGIKEGIGSPTYMQFNQKELVETNVFWNSDYQSNPPKDKIAFIRYS